MIEQSIVGFLVLPLHVHYNASVPAVLVVTLFCLAGQIQLQWLSAATYEPQELEGCISNCIQQ